MHAEQRESGGKVWNVYHPSLGSVGLIEHPHPGTDRFDERSVGLDHFALRVPDRAALEVWAFAANLVTASLEDSQGDEASPAL